MRESCSLANPYRNDSYFLTSRHLKSGLKKMMNFDACKSNAQRPSFEFRCKQVRHERKSLHFFLKTSKILPNFGWWKIWENTLTGFQKYECHLLFDSPPRNDYFFLTSRQPQMINFDACKRNAKRPSFEHRCKQSHHERKSFHFF